MKRWKVYKQSVVWLLSSSCSLQVVEVLLSKLSLTNRHQPRGAGAPGLMLLRIKPSCRTKNGGGSPNRGARETHARRGSRILRENNGANASFFNPIPVDGIG